MEEEGMDFQFSPEGPIHNMLPTVRMETDTLPPLVEMGRKLLIKAQDGDVEAVRDLMKQGAPFTTDWLGTSPLHWSCQLNHIEVTDALLTAGISRDSRNKVDRTPLHVTAQEGHVEILKLLMKFGVDVDATDMLGMTPLHWAAEYGHEECVKMLLEYGADPGAINKFDKTPDQVAFDNNRMDITHIIQEYAESPLRHIRRKEAKERQKQSSAAYKAVLELEKLNNKTHYSSNNEIKEVRIVKIPQKKKIPLQAPISPKIVFVKKNVSTPIVSLANGTLPEKVFSSQAADNNTEKTLAMLQAHGITMLPHDESTIVASAVQSGQRVVLTEAGKMALTQTEQPHIKKIIKLSPQMLKGKRLIKINSEDLARMRSERRLLIHTDKLLNQAMLTKKPSYIPVQIQKPQPEETSLELGAEDEIQPAEPSPPETDTDVTQESEGEVEERQGDEVNVEDEEVETELDRVKRELEETKEQVQEWQERCAEKDKEIREYKRIIDLLKVK